jgi:anti-sigma factor (TIGR02949 family)
MGNTEADCQALIAHLFVFIDGEIDEDRCAALQRHIDECPQCLGHVEFERAVKTIVRRKCEQSLPEGVMQRLLDRLGRA